MLKVDLPHGCTPDTYSSITIIHSYQARYGVVCNHVYTVDELLVYNLGQSCICDALQWTIYVAVPRQDSMSAAGANAVLSGHCNRFVGYL